MGFGLMYAGGTGTFFYNKIYPRLLPGKPFTTAVIDASIQSPLLYMPQYYLMAEVIKDATSLSSFRPVGELASASFATWKTNFAGDLQALLCFWVPFHTFNFTLFPVHLRMTVMSVIGFLWAVILSSLRGNTMQESSEATTQSQ